MWAGRGRRGSSGVLRSRQGFGQACGGRRLLRVGSGEPAKPEGPTGRFGWAWWTWGSRGSAERQMRGGWAFQAGLGGPGNLERPARSCGGPRAPGERGAMLDPREGRIRGVGCSCYSQRPYYYRCFEMGAGGFGLQAGGGGRAGALEERGALGPREARGPAEGQECGAAARRRCFGGRVGGTGGGWEEAAAASATALGLKEQCETLPEMLISVPHFIIPWQGGSCECVCVCVCVCVRVYVGLALPHGFSPSQKRDCVESCISGVLRES